VPFYLLFLGGRAWAGLQQVRVLRIIARGTRAARVVKVGRHSVGIRLFILALRRSMSPLAWYILTLCVMVVCWSTVLYYVERESCLWNETDKHWFRDGGYKDSGKRCMFQSVVDTFWWAIVTLTTVGYGDVHPVTGPGKFVASLTMMMGVLVLAFPMVILTHSFSSVYSCYVYARLGKADGERVEVDPEIRERFASCGQYSPFGNPCDGSDVKMGGINGTTANVNGTTAASDTAPTRSMPVVCAS